MPVDRLAFQKVQVKATTIYKCLGPYLLIPNLIYPAMSTVIGINFGGSASSVAVISKVALPLLSARLVEFR